MEYTIERIFNYLLQKKQRPIQVGSRGSTFISGSIILDLLTGEEKILMHRFVEGCGYKLGLWTSSLALPPTATSTDKLVNFYRGFNFLFF